LITDRRRRRGRKVKRRSEWLPFFSNACTWT